MNESRKICITFSPLDYPRWLANIVPRKLFQLLCRAQQYRRNPRDFDYMKSVAAQEFPSDLEFVPATDLQKATLRGAGEILLLWPDGNGYGWSGVEKRVFRWNEKGARVSVLNGRRRYFALTPSLRTSYLVRRLLERFWIGEVVLLVIFVLTSPFIVTWDLVKGKR